MHSTTVMTYKIAIVLRPQICDVISPYVLLLGRFAVWAERAGSAGLWRDHGRHCVVMGRPDHYVLLLWLIYFSLSNVRGRRTPLRGTFARIWERRIILQRRPKGPCLYPLYFERRKSANFASQFGATLNSCNLKPRLQMRKLKQLHLTKIRLFLTITARLRIRRPCSCWERRAVFWFTGQVTIIFVVSVCLFVQSFSQPSLIRFRSN